MTTSPSFAYSVVRDAKENREKTNDHANSWRREFEARARLAPRISRGPFFHAVLFRVTHDGLNERGTFYNVDRDCRCTPK